MKEKNILEIIDDEVKSVSKELEDKGLDPNDNAERWRVIARRYLEPVNPPHLEGE
uniref:Uncharacterized protein n=1 Tax=viral metagenome TaxID=1070528 RepID=A0A6H1ZPZ6_9ZZZZ